MQPGVMHLSTQTIKLYSNLLSFSERLKKAHRILTCGTMENKERFKRNIGGKAALKFSFKWLKYLY